MTNIRRKNNDFSCPGNASINLADGLTRVSKSTRVGSQPGLVYRGLKLGELISQAPHYYLFTAHGYACKYVPACICVEFRVYTNYMIRL